MEQKPFEYEILQNAAEACTRETGIAVKIKHPIKATQKTDATIAIHHHGEKVFLKAEIKSRITTVDALLPLMKARNEHEKFILVIPQVTTQMADRLRAEGSSWMRRVMYILNQPTLYIF